MRLGHGTQSMEIIMRGYFCVETGDAEQHQCVSDMTNRNLELQGQVGGWPGIIVCDQ